LANVYLNRLDQAWAARYGPLGELVRYADDLVILCPTKAKAQAALGALRLLLAELQLALAAAKTRLVKLEERGEGFDFLGFHHRLVEAFRRKGRYFCARWPSRKAMRAARGRIKVEHGAAAGRACGGERGGGAEPLLGGLGAVLPVWQCDPALPSA
jgi:RNA-directed DNA polymerase